MKKFVILILAAILGLTLATPASASAKPYTRTVVRGTPDSAQQAFHTIYADSAHSWELHLYVKSCPDNAGPESHYFLSFINMDPSEHGLDLFETWPTYGHFRHFVRIPKGRAVIHIQGGCNWTLTAPRRAHLFEFVYPS